MRLVTIRESVVKKYKQDKEMLVKSKRPCALIVQLRYKGHRYDFAVPLRSNIHPSTPKEQFFALPPRPATKSRHRHGIHYIKMFPIRKTGLLRYRTAGNKFAEMIKRIIDENEKEIIAACQRYLTDYENGYRPNFCTDIDLLLELSKDTQL